MDSLCSSFRVLSHGIALALAEIRMRRFLIFAPLMMACAVSPVPEANGYNVQLQFDGAPLGGSLVVGSPEIVTVRRIEQRTDRCTTTNIACDPTTETPIALVSATCDDGVCS